MKITLFQIIFKSKYCLLYNMQERNDNFRIYLLTRAENDRRVILKTSKTILITLQAMKSVHHFTGIYGILIVNSLDFN